MGNKRTLNRLLESKELSDNTEATRYNGKYYLLHICKNGTPVPLMVSDNATEIENYIGTL